MSNITSAVARTLNISQESVDVDINIGNDVATDEDGAVLSPVDNNEEPIIEAQEVEITEQSNDVEALEEEVEEGEQAEATLESISEFLGKHIEANQPLDTPSLEMFNITVGHLYQRYGIDAAEVYPSMESFDADPIGQLTISQEKVKETLKAVGEGTKQALAKMWASFVQLVRNVVKLNFSQEKRIKALIKRAEGLKNYNDSPGEIKLYRAKYVQVNGKVPSQREIVSKYEQTMVSVDKYMEALGYAYGDLVDVDLSSEDSIEKVLVGVSSKLQVAYPLAFQNAEIVNREIKVPFGKNIALPSLKVQIEGDMKRGPDSDAYKVEPLLPTEAIKVLNKVLKSNEAIKKFQSKATNKKFEKLVMEHNDLPEDKKERKAAVKKLKASIREIVKFSRTVLGYSKNVNSAMVGYAAQSISAYEKFQKKEDKK